MTDAARDQGQEVNQGRGDQDYSLKCNSDVNLTQGLCFGMKTHQISPPDTFFIENRVLEFARRNVWRPCYWLGALSFASKSAFLNH